MGAPGCDVAVVGGGLVGLSVAFELATRGATVTCLDAGLPGRATSAGAGILSPDTSADDDPGWFELARAAGAHYPALLDRIGAAGADVAGTGYAVCGLLSVILRPHEDDWFQPFADLVGSRSPDVVTEITPGAAQDLFPPLGPVHRVLQCTSAARVDGRGMAEALRRGAGAAGVRLVSGMVRGVGSRVGATRTVDRIEVEDEPDLSCGALVVAGGAWSARMGEWLGCTLPVTPTKGQIVHLGVSGATGSWPIVQPLLTHYLVPWPGGRVACGGTFEAGAGFDPEVTAAGLHELLREGLSVAPGLAGAAYGETRVGFRPTSADDRPVVGAVPGWDNVWVATGHGANGLLLGPYTGMLLAERITGEGAAAPDSWVGLGPARFGAVKR
ncbi:MAG: NAD(P)/FAD-dependent oxidoreductase [Acidimicrobiales bacterium]